MPQSVTKAIRDRQIISKRLSGETTGEIAAEMGVCRATVSRALNSNEARALVSEAENGMRLLLSKAVATIEEALDGGDINSALKAALVVLKSAGVLEAGARAEFSAEARPCEHFTDEELRARIGSLIAKYKADGG